MRFGKKVITWLMAMTMVFGLLPAQVMAEDGDTATYNSVVLELADDDANYLAGDTVNVKVMYYGKESESVILSGYQMYFAYDSAKLELPTKEINDYTVDYCFDAAGTFANWSDESSASASATSTDTWGYVNVAATSGQNYYYSTVQQGYSVQLGTLTFKVLADVEVGEGTISFDTSSANKLKDSDSSDLYADFSSSVTVNVVEEGIVLSGEGVTAGETENETAYKVTVDGENAIAITPTYYDATGADKTSEVSWYGGSNVDGNISIDSSNTITVSATAAQGTYTIEALSSSSSALATTDISVFRATSAADSIVFDTVVDSIEVPSTSTDNTADYSVTVKDQFGDAMTVADSDVTWSIVLKDGGATVDGVTVSGGIVTVTKAAATTILDTTGKTFTLTATCGTVSKTQDITIKRATSELTSLGISKDSGATIIDTSIGDTIAIPTSDSTIVTYTAVKYDQYGSEMVDNTSISWGTDDDVLDGVSWVKNASTNTATVTFTVTSDAETGDFLFSASVDDNNVGIASVTISIVDIAFTGFMTVKESPVYGDTWGNIFDIAKHTYAATLDGASVAGTYTVQVDEAAITMTNVPAAKEDSYAYKVLFTSTDGSGYTNETVATGTVDIAKATITDTTTTSQTAKYTGEAISITAPSATTVNDENYTIKYNTTSEDGEYIDYPETPLSYTTAGTYTIYYKITAENHTDATGTITFTISKEGSTTTTTPTTTPDDGDGTTSYSYTYGDTITLTAEVALDTSAGTASVSTVADPTVAFYVVSGGTETSLGTATVTSDGSATTTGVGTATLAYNTYGKGLAIGDNTIKAVYSGSVNLNGSTSDTISVKLVAKNWTSNDIVTGDIGKQTYTGSAITPTVSLTDTKNGASGTALVLNEDYKVVYSNNINAGTNTATVTVTGDGYYTGSMTAHFTISQATYTEVEKATTSSAKYGNTGTLDLSTVWESVGLNVTYSSESVDEIFSANPTVVNNVLSYTLAADSTKVDQTADISVSVTSTNYESFTGIITVTVADKFVSTLAVDDISKTYDGVAITASDIEGTATYGTGDDAVDVDGTWAFSTENGAKTTMTDVADTADYTVVFTPTEDDTYKEVTKQITVTISNASMTDNTDKKQTVTYTGVAQSISVPTATTVDGSSITVSYPDSDATSYTNVSINTINYTITAPNHTDVTDTITFTIEKAAATATPDIGDDDGSTGGDSTGDDSTGDDSEVVPDFTETYGSKITLKVIIGAIIDSVSGVATISAVDEDNLTGKTVYFYCGDTELGTVANVIEGQTASINVDSKTLAIGDNTVKVYYGGSDNLNGGLVATLTVAVEAKSLEHTDITVEDISAKDYTGSVITPTVVVKDDGTALTLDYDYEVEYDDNTNAGTAEITITGKGNYKDEVEKTFTINQIAYAGTTEQTSKAKYGNTGTLDLSNVWGIDGLKVTYTSMTDNNGIISGTPTIDDNVLSYTLVGDSAKVDLTATITVSVESTNYTTFTGTIVVTLLDKDIPIISVENIVKTYDGEAITLDDIDAETEVTGTWSFKDSTGVKYVADSGDCTLIFTPDDEYLADYIVEEKVITVTINPATITITADDVRAYNGSDEPTTYTYSVDGLVSGESLTTTPTLECLTVDMDTNGTYSITFATEATQTSGNYTLTHVNGTLTVYTTSSTSSYYIKVTVTGNGTVDPDGGADHMYEVKKGADAEFEFDADSGYEITDVIVDGSSIGVCDEYTFENVYAHGTLEVVFEKSSSSSSSGGGSSSSDDDEDDEDEDDDEDVTEEDADADVSTIEVPFLDTDADDEYYDGIAYVYENGIMAGITSEVFGSGMSITRGMIAAILYRINGSEPVDADMPFGDVPADQYYYNAVVWGKEAGVMAGMSDVEFSPDTAITNEQFVVFLFRYANAIGMDMTISAGADLSDYADAESISDYAYFAMLWAVDKGIIGEDDLLNPVEQAYRGDVANALMNFMEL